jgi:hypothetical protein
MLFLRSVRRLLVAAFVVPTSPILVTLLKETLGSSETSVLTRATLRNIAEDTILHSHRRENLKSYIENSSPKWRWVWLSGEYSKLFVKTKKQTKRRKGEM